ncbi:MAG: hypothetical protein AAES65_22900 [Candidatus Thiodiazotropha sp. (ex. Lucinoma kazani)]
MGQTIEKDGPVFPNLCIYLFDQDDERQNYLKHILGFVEGEVRVVKEPSEITLPTVPTGGACVAVFIGLGLDRDERVSIIRALTKEAPGLPVFQLYDEQGGAPEKLEGFENLIGSFKLPRAC